MKKQEEIEKESVVELILADQNLQDLHDIINPKKLRVVQVPTKKEYNSMNKLQR